MRFLFHLSMRGYTLFIWSLELLLLASVYSDDSDDSRCKKPKGKIGKTLFKDCSQSVCKNSDGAAKWEQCPKAAFEISMESRLDAIEKTTEDTENKIDKILSILGDGNWTVIQRRGQFGNPKDYFSVKLWVDYVNGFGNLYEEFWLGLKEIALKTSLGQWELKVDLEDFSGKTYFALYSNFRVNTGGPYSLSVSGYDAAQSTLQDSLSGLNDAPFSTSDNDNDSNAGNCAALYKGAWWYISCHSSNLNGYNYFDGDLPKTTAYYAKGIIWRNEKNVPEQDYYFSWPKVEMKIRRKA